MNGAGPEPVPTLVSIAGIRAMGRHGANTGERLGPQEFVVDAQVWLEVTGDSLEETLDYRRIVERARLTVEETSFLLLEALAEAVATDLLALPGALRVNAAVHKPGAARSMGVDDVWAEVSLGG